VYNQGIELKNKKRSYFLIIYVLNTNYLCVFDPKIMVFLLDKLCFTYIKFGFGSDLKEHNFS